VTIVIFGGAGDLAHRKLLPALYNLHVDGVLPPRIAVVGVGRKAMSDDEYRAFAKEGVEQFSRRPIDAQAWEILVYHFVDDLTQDEIAGMIGTSRKTVVRRLAAIREEARRLAQVVPAPAPARRSEP